MPKFKKPTPAQRKWMYNVGLASLPILTTTGVITLEMSGHVAGLMYAVMAIGESGLALARAHVPTPPKPMEVE